MPFARRTGRRLRKHPGQKSKDDGYQRERRQKEGAAGWVTSYLPRSADLQNLP